MGADCKWRADMTVSGQVSMPLVTCGEIIDFSRRMTENSLPFNTVNVTHWKVSRKLTEWRQKNGTKWNVMLTVYLCPYFDKVQSLMKNYWTLSDTCGAFVRDYVTASTELIPSRSAQIAKIMVLVKLFLRNFWPSGRQGASDRKCD